MAKEGGKSPKQLSESYLSQIQVLRALCQSSPGSRPKSLEIAEIADASGLHDEKEALRFLYILEGHKLVTPFPPGDFTSKTWQVTEEGIRAWKTISSELELAA